MISRKYKCKNCGYKGNKLIFQFNDYGYCLATNEEEPEYKGRVPKWAEEKGDAKIGKPVSCPKCRSWGVGNFEIIKQ